MGDLWRRLDLHGLVEEGFYTFSRPKPRRAAVDEHGSASWQDARRSYSRGLTGKGKPR